MSEESEIFPVEIRKLQRAEEARICAQFMATSEPWIPLHRTYDDSLKILRDPSKEVYVAVSGEMVVGFIIINMNGHFIGYIQTVCTGPAWRRKGIGSQLLAFAEERIFRETPNVFMCVSSFNTEAQKLYQRLGYEVIGELRDYLVYGDTEILLRKTRGPLTGFRKGGCY